MIKQEGSTRFTDSQLWTKFYDELQAMRTIIDTEDPEETSVLGTEGHTPDNSADLLFPYDGTPLSPEILHPDPVHAFRLWQIFLDRVNPLTKIVHVPSLQPYLIDITTDPSSVPLNYQALFFSIYLMATISLLDHECVQLLGMSHEQAIQRFAKGTRQALIKHDFLRNHDMSVMQALVFFLYALQGRHDKQAAWVLGGTVIRIAQKMGYHRDGELLKLTPFETEMRRRIWWQIIHHDAKLAIMSGLNTIFHHDMYDTKQPLNLSDSDLYPGSPEPVHAREGPTEMAFSLITNRLTRFMTIDTTIKGLEAAIFADDCPDENHDDKEQQTSSTSPSHIPLVEKYRRLFRELETDLLAIEHRYCDPSAGNAHAAAIAIRPLLVQKFHEMLVPMREQSEWGTEIFGPSDNLFKIALMNNEHNTDLYDQFASLGFLWYVKIHFQLDVFAVLTGQLCKRPTGSLSDRAWQIVGKIYQWQTELFHVSQKHYAAQAQYTLKAWRARERAFAINGMHLETPDFICRLRELVPSSQDSRSSTQASMSPPPPGMDQQQLPQHPTHGQQPQQPMTDMDQFLGGYLDMSALNWDVWGDMGNNAGPDNGNNRNVNANSFNNGQLSSMFFDGFNLGGFGMPHMK